jgi:small conductance mechanosensitive channel
LATVVNVFKPSYGVFLGGIMVAYYFAEMLTSKKLIEKALALTESKNRSPSYKLAAFVNRKVVFLCLAAMSSIVFINHSPSNKLFFENLIDIFHVLLAIFALQACISAVINKFICKLESIRDGAHSSSPTSQRQKNLIWICDVIVIVLYLAMACLLLKFIGINLHEHIFHDKTMTVFGIIFITIVIYKGFNEFADTILENAKNNNQDNYKIKLQTFLPTLSAIFYIILFATSALLVLANLGVNIAPILATFTVFSAAVGLAAQDIIRSFLHGITFLIEKNLYVGAYIQIDGKSGVIEKLSARVLYLRDDNGALHVIPYNVINVITNYSKDYSYHYGELHINDGDDVEKVSNILIDVVKNMKKEENYRNSILGEVIVHGLKPFNLTGPKIYWKMKVSPDAAGKAVQYELYRRLYQEYGKRKMHIPIANSIISTVS